MLLIVSARGPVMVIYALPWPKQKPFLGFSGEEKSVGRLYEFGGGLVGTLH